MALELPGVVVAVPDGDLALRERGGVYKCALQPVRRAIRRGLYGDWEPSGAERGRLDQIFPAGVCDYDRRDQGRPPGDDSDSD